MRVGLTYDLREVYLAEGYGVEETAEFDSPATIDSIAAALARPTEGRCRVTGARAVRSHGCPGGPAHGSRLPVCAAPRVPPADASGGVFCPELSVGHVTLDEWS